MSAVAEIKTAAGGLVVGAHRRGTGAVKVLLDVCTPVQVRQALPGHDVFTAVKMGFPSRIDYRLVKSAATSPSA